MKYVLLLALLLCGACDGAGAEASPDYDCACDKVSGEWVCLADPDAPCY